MISDSNWHFVRIAKRTMIECDGRYSKVSEFLSSNILLQNVLSGQTVYQDNTYSNSHKNNFLTELPTKTETFWHLKKPVDHLLLKPWDPIASPTVSIQTQPLLLSVTNLTNSQTRLAYSVSEYFCNLHCRKFRSRKCTRSSQFMTSTYDLYTT